MQEDAMKLAYETAIALANGQLDKLSHVINMS